MAEHGITDDHIESHRYVRDGVAVRDDERCALELVCAESGGTFPHIGDDHAKAKEEAEDFLVSYYGVNHWGDRWGPWGTPDEIAARMREFADAGADHLIVRFAGWDQRAQWERFEAEVLPAFV